MTHSGRIYVFKRLERKPASTQPNNHIPDMTSPT